PGVATLAPPILPRAVRPPRPKATRARARGDAPEADAGHEHLAGPREVTQLEAAGGAWPHGDPAGDARPVRVRVRPGRDGRPHPEARTDADEQQLMHDLIVIFPDEE